VGGLVRADTVVDGDQQAHAFGVGGVDVDGAEAVAFGKAAGHAVADVLDAVAAQAIQQYGGCSDTIDVVVAEDADVLLALARLGDARYGGVHAGEEEGVGQMAHLGGEKALGGVGGVRAAKEQELADQWGDVERGGQGAGARGVMIWQRPVIAAVAWAHGC
jgi:hypothetical protein